MNRPPIILAALAILVSSQGIAASDLRQEPSTRDTVSLTLARARELVLTQSPRSLAARAQLEAAHGAARAFSTYRFNPRAEFKAVELFNPGGASDFEAILSQEIEWAGQAGLRSSAARFDTEASTAVYGDRIRLLRAEVDLAYIAVVAAEQRSRVHLAAARVVEDLDRAVGLQYRSGEVSPMEVNLASIQAGRAEAARIVAEQELATLRRELAGLLGIAPGTFVNVVDQGLEVVSESEGLDDLVARALALRPDVIAARGRISQSEELERLSRRELIPTLGLAAVADRNGPGQPTTLGLRVSVPLPFWDRNQGVRQQRSAEARVRAEELRDLEVRVQIEVSGALDLLQASREALSVYEERVLGPVESNRQLLERARASGQLDLPTALLLQSQLWEAELAYWNVWLAEQSARVALNAAVGDFRGGAEG